ncbi:TlpA family protein disulfide reductase [Phenylobacterium sp.]|uniref:TlpA family protein disulfide reductase n=1 Tax=Phenylobacterium sp. TaxID=1871053 RepID=UPI0039835E46
MTATAQGFSLRDMTGATRAFPTGRPSLICFVKEDCDTCNLAAPVLEAFHQAWGDLADIWMVGQSADGNAILRDRHGLTLSILDDSALRTSLAWGFDIVPAIYWIGADGAQRPPLEGFVRQEWETLAQQIAGELKAAAAAVAWGDLPAWRPGCGSKHLDPEIHDRLLAEAEGSPIRARRIEIASADDIDEFMFDQGFSDGLPVVPPTPERVLRMLSGTTRDPQDIVAIVPPNMAPATVEKIAINAVMAGCRPEYLPVVIAAVEAVCTDEFNMHGVTATTMGASPVLVVNGPIRSRIGMNMKLGALGNGNRANATIGRALRLVVRNLGGARPGGVDRSTLSSPMKFTMCFAEWEEGSPWDPLHVERGFQREDSVVTAFAMTSGPVQIVDQESRKPDQIAGTLGLGLEGMFLSKIHRMPVDALLVVCPEHVRTLTVEGAYSKTRLRERIQTVTSRQLREMVSNEVSGAGIPVASAARMTDAQLAAPAPKFASDKFIHIVVAGSEAGKFSAAFHGWVTGPAGSTVVSRKIDC